MQEVGSGPLSVAEVSNLIENQILVEYLNVVCLDDWYLVVLQTFRI